MRRRSFLWVTFFSTLSVWWTWPVRSEAAGPWKGQVVDAETKDPIEGAVVLAVWTKYVWSPLDVGGPNYRYYDSQEVLTDTDGRFTIAARHVFSFNPFASFRGPDFLIFKPGYGYFPWYHTRPTGNISQVFQGEGTVVELPKLKTREERRQKDVSLPDVPREKMPHLMRLINIDRVETGLEPLSPLSPR